MKVSLEAKVLEVKGYTGVDQLVAQLQAEVNKKKYRMWVHSQCKEKGENSKNKEAKKDLQMRKHSCLVDYMWRTTSNLEQLLYKHKVTKLGRPHLMTMEWSMYTMPQKLCDFCI